MTDRPKTGLEGVNPPDDAYIDAMVYPGGAPESNPKTREFRITVENAEGVPNRLFGDEEN